MYAWYGIQNAEGMGSAEIPWTIIEGKTIGDTIVLMLRGIPPDL